MRVNPHPQILIVGVGGGCFFFYFVCISVGSNAQRYPRAPFSTLLSKAGTKRCTPQTRARSWARTFCPGQLSSGCATEIHMAESQLSHRRGQPIQFFLAPRPTEAQRRVMMEPSPRGFRHRASRRASVAAGRRSELCEPTEDERLMSTLCQATLNNDPGDKSFVFDDAGEGCPNCCILLS